ncbi:MAG: family 1 glycosylhydrolase [Proteobacteria bacterium]|nr:family 1 glycosylhydrolase [Pseudomonadota bacterium]
MEIAIIIGIIGFGIILVTLWGKLKKPLPSAKVKIDGQSFPEGFLWSTGEDAYQHEGGNYNNDWARWENQVPSPIANGDRCEQAVNFYQLYESDFVRAKNDFQNAHRIGIEWSRIEPEEGVYDLDVLDHYEKMLKSMKAKGFKVFLNLWHFTLPLWAVDKGGWTNESLMDSWCKYIKLCTERFAKYVDYWSTMIDAQIYALSGYALGDIPPNVKDQKQAFEIYRILIYAHARAYKIIKEFGTVFVEGKKHKPRVGMIYFFFLYQPQGFFLDRIVTKQLDELFNWKMLDAFYSGRVDIGILGGPKIKEENEQLKGTIDWIGINYYTREIISFNPFKPGFIARHTCKASQTTDTGWEIYPEGIYTLCKVLQTKYPGIPLMVTESGLADAYDEKRPQFILDHLAWLHRFIEEGGNLIGFTYWSLTDNWEWAEGFWPKFGLYSVDLETFERRERPSARLFRSIVRNNSLPTRETVEQILNNSSQDQALRNNRQ